MQSEVRHLGGQGRLSRLPCLAVFAIVAAGALLVRPLGAQIVDTLRGRVTAAGGKGIAGARIAAVRRSSSQPHTATADSAGFFLLPLPRDSGVITVTATAPGFSQAQSTTSAATESSTGGAIIVAFQLLPVAVRLPPTRVTASTRQRPRRAERAALDAGTSRGRVSSISDLTGDNPGDLAEAVSMLPGVSLTDGGFSVLGADPGRNVMTLGGMLFTGPSLPRDAVLALDVGATATDASQSGFTGGRLDLSLFSIAEPTRSARFTVDHPAMQWPATPASAPDARFTNVQMSGYVSNRVGGDRASFSASWQVGRRTGDAAFLGSSPLLSPNSAGVASDSIRALLAAATQQGVPLAGGTSRHTTTSGSFVTAWNWAISDDAGAGLSAVVQATGRDGDGLGPFTDVSYGRRTSSSDLFLLARAHRYFGFMLNELKIAGNISRNRSSPYVDAPSARVTAESNMDGGGSSFTSVALGGNPSAGLRDVSNVELNDRTSWMSAGGHHRFDLTLSSRFDAYEIDGSSDANGTFGFASIEDFRNARPAWFTRSFGRRLRSGRDVAAFAALTDAWEPAAQLHLTAGIRADINRFLDPPPYVGLADSLFGMRTDVTPSSVVLSPSIGASWSYGRLPDRLKDQFGEAPRAAIGAGLANLVGNLSSTLLDPARAQQNLGVAPSRIACTGPAAPPPDWKRYALDAGAIPTACQTAGVPGVFRDRSPTVYAFDPGLGPDRALRANLWWSGRVSPRIHARLEVLQSFEWDRMAPLDRNLETDRGFTILAENSRPVFARPQDIDPHTGLMSLSSSRTHDQLGRVYEYRASQRARRTQYSARITRTTDDASRNITFGYAYLRTREEQNGFDGTTAGDPARVEWGRGQSDGVHQLTLTGSFASEKGITLSFAGRASSGYRFTPVVSGDVNADGLVNDRAFVADPGMPGDVAVREGIKGLLSAGPSRVQRCLRAQLNGIARVNSCAAPWSAMVNFSASIRGGSFGLPSRSMLSVVFLDVPAALDRLLNGPQGVRGWGRPPAVDPTLITVRGFDPSSQRFLYATNPFFGKSPPAIAALSSPSRLSIGLRIDLGPDRDRRYLETLLRGGRSQAGMPYRDSSEILQRFVGDGPSVVSVLLMSTSSLRLSASQRSDLLAIRDSTVSHDRAVFAPLAGYLASLHEGFDAGTVHRRLDPALAASARIAEAATLAARAVLTKEQMRTAPPYVRRALDPGRAAAQRQRGMLTIF